MRYHVASMIALGILAACVVPTTSCGCSTVPPTALIVGTIRTADARPIIDAVVGARSAAGTSCAQTLPAGATGGYVVRTDVNGRYRLPIIGVLERGAMCVQVVARRSSGATADSLTAPVVRLVASIVPPYDSAIVDLQFP